MQIFFNSVHTTVLHETQLVEAMDVEPWKQRVKCKIIHGFFISQDIGTSNPCCCSRFHYIILSYNHDLKLPRGASGKEPAYQCRDAGSSPGSGRSLEEDTAMYSSIFAWRIPLTEKPGRLQALGLQKAGHD